MKQVFKGLYQEDAMVLKSMLESADIPTELLSGGKLDVNPLFNVDITGFTLQVPDDCEADALDIVAAYNESKHEHE